MYNKIQCNISMAYGKEEWREGGREVIVLTDPRRPIQPDFTFHGDRELFFTIQCGITMHVAWRNRITHHLLQSQLHN